MATSYMLAPGESSAEQEMRRRMAYRLMEEAGDASPVQHWTQALARVVKGGLGAYGLKKGKEEDEAERASGRKMLTDFLMGATGATGSTSATPSTPAPAERGTYQRILASSDEPSPLDPPGGNDRDKMIRLIHAEAGNEAPEGQQAVANVIRNRAVSGAFGGGDAAAVMDKPYAFEPTMTPQGRARMASIDPAGPGYAQIGAAVDRAYTGDDPTGGATHFYSPKGQAALGRPPPAWGRGPGQDIGQHRFFGGAGGQPVQMAMAGPGMPTGAPSAPPPPQSTQMAQATPQAAQAGMTPDRRQMLIQMLNNRNTSPIAQGLIQEEMKRQFTPKLPNFDKLNDDTLYDKGTGRTMPVGPGYKPVTDPAERAKFGIPPDDRRPYQVGPAGKLINPPPETRFTVDQRGESEFSKKAATLQAERFNELIKSGNTARDTVADLENLREIGSRITTGKTAEITAALGPYAETLGIKIDKLGDMQAYQSIVSKLAPNMRPPGSGATSDFDMRQYLNALPSLGKTPEGNKLVANTNQAILEHRMAAAEIGSRALSGEITAREAEKELRALPDPLALWKKAKGAGPAAKPAVPDRDALKKKYGLE
jgi:hypothetical protein